MKKTTLPTFTLQSVGLAVCLSSTATLANNVTIINKIDLGTLHADNAGNSEIRALSADGKTAGGWANNNLATPQAVIWSGNDYTTKTNLGRLPDSSRESAIDALSADGKVAGHTHLESQRIVGSHSRVRLGENYATNIVLGTLQTDNAGNSEIRALSADGKTVGGWAKTKNGIHATIWSGDDYATKTDLGTLTGDESGSSSAEALSSDGKVVGGWASNVLTDYARAVIWSGDNYATETDLGTLKSHNLGGSNAYALSSDGKVAGGRSQNDLNDGFRAVIWSGDDYATKTDLGTLKADNSGESSIYALSADGKVAGGRSQNDLNDGFRAVIWSGDDYATKTDLGTLKADNSGESSIYALSADGKVAGGRSQNDLNDGFRAVIWRLNHTDSTTNPTTPAVVNKIDVNNTIHTIDKLGKDSFGVMAMQAHTLDRLQYSCFTDNGLCYNLYQDTSISKNTKDNKRHDIGVGASIGYGFGNGLSVGISLDHSAHRKLPSSYRHQGDDVGIGAVVRYEMNDGVFAEASFAKNDYTATITRPTLANTELGVNETTIKGMGFGATVGKIFKTNRHTLTTHAGAKHFDISRDAYQENQHTAFPIHYGKMSHKATYATIGSNIKTKLSDKIFWINTTEISQKLLGDDPVYTASLTGVEKHHFTHTATSAKTVGHFSTGVQYQISNNAHLEFMPYAKRYNDNETGYGALFKIEGKFQ